MITLFAIPKAMIHPHIAMIQKNAIESWLVLKKKYGMRIILCCDDEGIEEYAGAVGVESIPDVERHEGIPVLSDVFNKVQARCPGDTVVYVNADIILFGNLIQAICRAKVMFGQFLLIGQRFNWATPRPISFTSGWQNKLLAEVYANGWLDPPVAVDYFAFPSGMILDMPPFLIGRYCTDSWLVSTTFLCKKIPVIDTTPVVSVIHQDHKDLRHPRGGDLANYNRSMLPDMEIATKGRTDMVPWVMTEKGIEKRA